MRAGSSIVYSARTHYYPCRHPCSEFWPDNTHTPMQCFSSASNKRFLSAATQRLRPTCSAKESFELHYTDV